MEMHRYIIDASKPFKGTTESATYLNHEGKELVMYSGYLYNNKQNDFTLEEYMEHKKNKELKAITWEEYEVMLTEYNNSLKTKPTEITEERYYEMLEVLPPCRWHSIRGASVFHVSERITGDLVSWFIKLNGKFYEFTESCFIKDHELDTIIKAI